MKTSIFLVLILLSNIVISNETPVQIIQIDVHGDSMKLTYDEFTKQILVDQFKIHKNTQEELIKSKEHEIIYLKQVFKLQKIIIYCIIGGIVGIISFPLFILYLILYINIKRKLKKIPNLTTKN
jgi:hypothetical protein